jgi:hypothetical protein
MASLQRQGLLLLGTLLAVGLGCAKAPRVVPNDVTWPLDRVAILIPLEEPPLEFQKPVVGTMAGLGVGLGRGSGVTVLIALSGLIIGPLGLFATVPIAGVVGAVYIPASTVGGAVDAESADHTAAGDLGILMGIAELHVNRRLGAQLQQAFRDLSGRDLPLVEGDLDAAAGTADWYLEARILGIWNGGTIGFVTVDRPCELHVAAGLRLIRASDGRAIAGRVAVFTPPSLKYTYSEWGEEGGRRLKEGVVEGCSVLARTFVEELYLETKPLRSPP